MPSPVRERPGLLIRDPHRFSDVTLIVPTALVEALRYFDGQLTELDLRQHLVRLIGSLDVGDVLQGLKDSLSKAGFLHDEEFARLRDERIRAFVEAPHRAPAHAGSAYPDEPARLKETFDGYFRGAQPPESSGDLIGIAAPHVSPEGGWESYRDAYCALTPEYGNRVFVILGTSHQGEPEKFGLTKKNFVTPYGEARTESALVDWLAARAPGAVNMDDYCHSTEHSIEFQVAFLQHVYGPDVRIVPVLCGSYAHSIYGGGMPEDDENVKRFLGSLAELNARENGSLFWILGVDMAHMGRRYGDRFPAVVDRGEMEIVGRRDRGRIDSIVSGDSASFWDQVKENRDDLKWCGSSPFYTFLRAVPGARGEVRRYQQWNIDEASVVSFGAIAFRQV